MLMPFLRDALQIKSQLEWLGSLEIPPAGDDELNNKFLRKVSAIPHSLISAERRTDVHHCDYRCVDRLLSAIISRRSAAQGPSPTRSTCSASSAELA